MTFSNFSAPDALLIAMSTCINFDPERPDAMNECHGALLGRLAQPYTKSKTASHSVNATLASLCKKGLVYRCLEETLIDSQKTHLPRRIYWALTEKGKINARLLLEIHEEDLPLGITLNFT